LLFLTPTVSSNVIMYLESWIFADRIPAQKSA
jgi:hypothetical protein